MGQISNKITLITLLRSSVHDDFGNFSASSLHVMTVCTQMNKQYRNINLVRNLGFKTKHTNLEILKSKTRSLWNPNCKHASFSSFQSRLICSKLIFLLRGCTLCQSTLQFLFSLNSEVNRQTMSAVQMDFQMVDLLKPRWRWTLILKKKYQVQDKLEPLCLP